MSAYLRVKGLINELNDLAELNKSCYVCKNTHKASSRRRRMGNL